MLKDQDNLRLAQTILVATIEGLHHRFESFFNLEEESHDAVIAAFKIQKYKFIWFPCLKDRIKTVKIIEDLQRLISVTAQKKEFSPFPQKSSSHSYDKEEDSFLTVLKKSLLVQIYFPKITRS